MLTGEAKIDEWLPSRNDYDWLGHGIYFWEHGPERARNWPETAEIVVGAVIQLGNCLDLTDLSATELLGRQYRNVAEAYRTCGKTMPTNEAGDWQLRRLDCLVINELVNALATPGAEGSPPLHVQTVRGAFEEGNEAFPGSMIKMQTHIQIAVRDHACILGVFLPHLRKE